MLKHIPGDIANYPVSGVDYLARGGGGGACDTASSGDSVMCPQKVGVLPHI